jgi:hypothetical protein
MEKQEMLINLSGQVINGILSSNSSWLSKLLESSFHDQVADISVSIAKRMTEKILAETT